MAAIDQRAQRPAGRRTGPVPGAGAAIERGAVAASVRRNVWVVPHTHWDREWYLPFEHFRWRLVRTLDEILEVLERDQRFARFTLDGQAILLEDYLEARPEAEGWLRALIAAGRLAIGPSYVLPDEFLVGQESLVRNLLIGRQVCARFGRPMAVGYLPDTFGHVAQLPQILRGFGLDSFVFWRGLGEEGDDLGAVFTWRAPDGSEVLAVRQLDGYGSGSELGRWGPDGRVEDPARRPEAACWRVRRFLDTWERQFETSGLRDVLLCNGSDHQPIQRDLPAMLAACADELPDCTFRVATYAEYVDAIRDRIGPQRVREGELLGARYAPILRGVNSARTYLKQENAEAERALFEAEALASLAALRGAQYPLAGFRLAWRELLKNHPHDSISGCSVDEVHRDMLPRFARVRQIAERLRREGLAALAGREARWSYREEPMAEFAVVNVLPWERRGVVTVPLAEELRRAWALRARVDGRVVPVQTVSEGGRRSAVLPVAVSGFGAVQVRLERGEAAPPVAGARALGPATIENEVCRVEAQADGSLRVTERASGRTWTGLHRFLDEGDRGDEYTFCPVESDRVWTSDGCAASVRVLAAGPWVAELEIALVARLPRRLSRDRRSRVRGTVPCPIRTVVRLAAGSDRIELETRVDNRARDHRLRVVFAAPGAGPEVRAEGHFAVVRRAARPAEPRTPWHEAPPSAQHTLGAVAAGDLAIFARGLAEYEAWPVEGGLEVGLTLLRCVGWLSRPDLNTRPGDAGPQLETPEAQCLGEHKFRYALRLGSALDDAELVRAAQDDRVGFAVAPAGANPGAALRVEGEGFALAALKGAEDGDGVIVRVYNPGRQGGRARIVTPGRATLVRLDEEPVGDLAGGELPLRGGQIASVRVATG